MKAIRFKKDGSMYVDDDFDIEEDEADEYPDFGENCCSNFLPRTTKSVWLPTVPPPLPLFSFVNENDVYKPYTLLGTCIENVKHLDGSSTSGEFLHNPLHSRLIFPSDFKV